VKRFSFRLERVLQLRESAEQEKARQLGLALRDEEQARLSMEEGQAKLEAARTQLARITRAPAQAGMLRNLELSVEQLTHQETLLREAHARCVEKVDADRAQFEEARMAKRVIERLKEQRREAWIQELARYEQSLSDETASFLARENSGRDE
jgi:flagellar export protein FliJ